MPRRPRRAAPRHVARRGHIERERRPATLVAVAALFSRKTKRFRSAVARTQGAQICRRAHKFGSKNPGKGDFPPAITSCGLATVDGLSGLWRGDAMLIQGLSTVIAIGSLAGNVSRSASSSRSSRWAAAALLWLDAACFFRCLKKLAPAFAIAGRQSSDNVSGQTRAPAGAEAEEPSRPVLYSNGRRGAFVPERG